MQYDYIKGLGLRFLRGFVAGATGAAAPVVIVFKDWDNVIPVLSVLGLAALAGGITGGILALDKYVRTPNEGTTTSSGEAGTQ